MKISGFLKGRVLQGRTARIRAATDRELYGNAKRDSAVHCPERVMGFIPQYSPARMSRAVGAQNGAVRSCRFGPIADRLEPAGNSCRITCTLAGTRTTAKFSWWRVRNGARRDRSTSIARPGISIVRSYSYNRRLLPTFARSWELHH